MKLCLKRNVTVLALAVTVIACGCMAQADLKVKPKAVSASSMYPDLPNPVLTPGVVRATDLATIDATEKATEVGRPNQAIKDKVYREYGLDPRHHQPCEIDHFLPIECGGSNDIKNLFPEHYSEPWGAHTKDKLENHLRALIVAGVISVTEAQNAIRTNWIDAYKKYMGVSVNKQ